jgi:hypothetical protein
LCALEALGVKLVLGPPGSGKSALARRADLVIGPGEEPAGLKGFKGSVAFDDVHLTGLSRVKQLLARLLLSGAELEEVTLFSPFPLDLPTKALTTVYRSPPPADELMSAFYSFEVRSHERAKARYEEASERLKGILEAFKGSSVIAFEGDESLAVKLLKEFLSQGFEARLVTLRRRKNYVWRLDEAEAVVAYVDKCSRDLLGALGKHKLFLALVGPLKALSEECVGPPQEVLERLL